MDCWQMAFFIAHRQLVDRHASSAYDSVLAIASLNHTFWSLDCNSLFKLL